MTNYLFLLRLIILLNKYIRNLIWKNFPSRCQDNTEGGTFLSAIVCNTCGDGPMLPQHPLDPQSCWSCQKCEAVITHEEQETLLQRSLEVSHGTVYQQFSLDYQHFPLLDYQQFSKRKLDQHST